MSQIQKSVTTITITPIIISLLHIVVQSARYHTIYRMGKITKGLESLLAAGKSFGKVLKSKAVIAGMAAALPFMMANYAKASEGAVRINHIVDGVGNSRYSLAHISGALEGIDNNDGIFYPMFCPDCEVTTKIISYVDSKELRTDVRPLDSETSATVSCSMISKSGESIVVENAPEYLSIEVSGFEGYDVFVNGENARETSGIDFGTLTGSYGSGETIRTVEITFEKQSGPVIVAPSLDTESASNISANSATLKGKIIEDGNPSGSEQCEYRFSYWKNGGSHLSTNWSCCVDDGDGFTFGVSGLQSNTAYSFQAEARNSAGASVGDLESFVTSNVVDPDPNTGPVVIPGSGTSNTLFIANWIEGYSNEANGKWTFTYLADASAGKDAKDVVYAKPSSYSFWDNSKIVSVVNGANRTQKYELKVDARPLNNTTNASLQLSVENKNGTNIEFATPTMHELRFSFPSGLPKDTTFFDSKPITIWQVDPLHKEVTSPVRDVRKIIEMNPVANTTNTGRLALSQLSGIYNSGIPDSYWVISTNKKLGDIDNSGIVDVNDYIIIQEFQGFSGSTNVDVAGSRGLGLPDGVVDGFDLYYEYGAMSPNEASKINPAPTLLEIPYVIEGFESGALGDDWSKWQWPQWKVVSSNPYEGTYCVRSAAIDDNGSTSLTWKVNECADGEVSFYKRVSIEKGFDPLVFYIDNKEQGRWSGELPWEKASYPISAGNHSFKWEYSKDSSGVYGQDAAWIDQVKVSKVNTFSDRKE